MDILYILSKDSDNDNLELRLSLRSLEKYAENVDNVFIVGAKPKWIKNIKHIKAEDNSTRENNAFYKVISALKDISENFLFMNDDFFMMKPFDCKTYPYYVCGDVSYIDNPSRYQEIQNKTLRVLEKNGIDEIKDFRSHCPIRFNKQNFRILRKYFDNNSNKNIGYSTRLLYGNFFVKDYIECPDCKLWGSDEIHETQQGCISTKDDCKEILDYLLTIFPEKSKYEKEELCLE